MLTHTLGFSRMGKERELKKALEAFWRGEIDGDSLESAAGNLRLRHWELQKNAGIDVLPAGDFSLYDHILDMTAMLGAVPERYAFSGDRLNLETYFLMARGGVVDGKGVAPMEMSKWFDSNYHYIVPEFTADQSFSLCGDKLFAEVAQAVEAGFTVKAVLPGPLTFLYSGKSVTPGFNRFDHLPAVVAAYARILEKLSRSCSWIQLDEPVLSLDMPSDLLGGQFRKTYETLAKAAGQAKIMVAAYFGSIAHNLAEIADAPIAGLHLDLARAPEQLGPVMDALPAQTILSLGVVNGRNIWRVDADKAHGLNKKAEDSRGRDAIMLAPSCSLLHVPVDMTGETDLPEHVRRWMAFGLEKCRELRMLADAASGKNSEDALTANRAAWEERRVAPELHRAEVRQKTSEITQEMLSRSLPYPERRALHEKRFALPLLPTTTIGSFPQTQGIRKARRDFKRGDMDRKAYEQVMREEIRDAVARQEELGLDVLVHGEPERNDMVEYFGERLNGFCFTQNGWVQSYGSRCVKPPVIYGDVSREGPMTVSWSAYAQSLTKKPMKGMLTGPVTILCWSFVRDDQPRDETCRQIALAIRDEVRDLEQAGIGIIQVDEPALREGAPLRKADWDEYFRWAVACFRLASNGAAPDTQMHTHMCYSEFNEIVEHIAAMDADAISIEASRSRMELLEAFKRFRYPNEIGPGVYDIHSPRVPDVEEICELLRRAAEVIPAGKLWVNPDCGLKTRGWEETMAALANMVQAARIIRNELSA